MILCSGCFDGLHAGHVGYLEAVARIAGPVAVAVANDDYLRTNKDGPHGPEAARLNAVKGLACVNPDYVFLHGVDGASDAIEDGPAAWDGFAKGMDWYGRLPDDIVVACRCLGIPLIFVDSGSDLHTNR